MGKLGDLIKRVTRREQEPMGFGSATRKSQHTLLLVAIVGDHWGRAAAEAVDAGADALLLVGRPGETDVKEAVAAAKDRSVGLLSPEATVEQLERYHGDGLAFAVVGPNAPAAALVDDMLSLAFHLRDDLTDVELRTLEGMAFEAIYIDREAAPATIMRILELQRIAGLARKPLLVHVGPDTHEAELIALRGAGVALAGLDMRDRNASDVLRKLREIIDGLPRKKVRSEDRTRISLPHSSPAEASEANDDDEDDE